MRYFCTVPKGVEGLATRELRRLGASVRHVTSGRVFFIADDEFIYVGNSVLRTVNRIFIELTCSDFRTLMDIKEIASSLSYVEFLRSDSSFAVRAERVGVHDFTSVDVAREVGAGIIESYKGETGVRPEVNLRKPDVEVHAFVVNNEVVIGVNTTGVSLHKRRYRVYDHPAALKTTLAAALLELLDYRGGSFLDPMCGGGTIVIEAAHRVMSTPIAMFRQDYAYRKLKLYDRNLEREIITDLISRMELPIDTRMYCIDISPKHLAGAQLNTASANTDWITTLIRGDSTLTKTYSQVDADIRYASVNPPYGIRFHNPKKLPTFYREFLSAFFRRFPSAKLALITAATKVLESVANAIGVRVEESINVMHGGLRAKMYVLRV